MASALVPPTIGLLLDREGRTDKEIDEVSKETQGAVTFLDRPMLENYLLSVPAILSVLRTGCDDLPESIIEETIDHWIRTHGANTKYRTNGLDPLSDEWLRRVHGSRLLTDLFSELTDHRLEFRKTTHCEALTRWLLSESPDFLDPLIKILETKLRCERQ